MPDVDLLARGHPQQRARPHELLLRLWPVTEALTTIALAQDQAVRDDPARARRIHAALVEAILGGDPALIRDALDRHTLDSAEELVALQRTRTGADPG